MLSADTKRFLELAASRPEELWRAEFAQALTAINRLYGCLGLIVLFTLLRRITHPWGRVWFGTVSDGVLVKPVHRVGSGWRSPVDSDSASVALDYCFTLGFTWAAFNAVLVIFLQSAKPRTRDLRSGAGGSGAARGGCRMG